VAEQLGLSAILAVTEPTREALRVLRDPANFSWTTITLLGLAVYVYAVEIERRNWSAVLAGLAFWGMDWINEVANALVLHFTDRAPIWVTTGHTSYQILIGLNIEISLLFFISGIVHWHYWWWNFPNVTLIVLLGYATFFAAAAYVYDLRERAKQLRFVGALAAIDVTLILLFGPILEWI
jgi:hypothetical protein